MGSAADAEAITAAPIARIYALGQLLMAGLHLTLQSSAIRKYPTNPKKQVYIPLTWYPGMLASY